MVEQKSVESSVKRLQIVMKIEIDFFFIVYSIHFYSIVCTLLAMLVVKIIFRLKKTDSFRAFILKTLYTRFFYRCAALFFPAS